MSDDMLATDQDGIIDNWAMSMDIAVDAAASAVEQYDYAVAVPEWGEDQSLASYAGDFDDHEADLAGHLADGDRCDGRGPLLRRWVSTGHTDSGPTGR